MQHLPAKLISSLLVKFKLQFNSLIQLVSSPKVAVIQVQFKMVLKPVNSSAPRRRRMKISLLHAKPSNSWKNQIEQEELDRNAIWIK